MYVEVLYEWGRRALSYILLHMHSFIEATSVTHIYIYVCGCSAQSDW